MGHSDGFSRAMISVGLAFASDAESGNGTMKEHPAVFAPCRHDFCVVWLIMLWN